jgi:branched-chain amino acid transport system ATP-binding protein
VHGIDLTVERGTIVALLGANGAGKTSTLRAITGAATAEGTIVFDGASLRGVRPERAARLGIAHAREGRGTLTEFSVRENLALGAYTDRDAARVRARRERIYGYFPWLAEREHQRAGSLSGGEQQQLAIARALMLDPKLMLLDEPSLGLAPILVRGIFDLLQTINRDEGLTILVAEQNAAIALAAASRAFVLEAGRIVASGPSSDLLRDDRIRQSYLGY